MPTIEIERLTETKDSRLPWANWRNPHVTTTPVGEVSARLIHDINEVGLYVGEELVGIPTHGALQEMSTRVGFPTDFLLKLPKMLQAHVLNDRIGNFAYEKPNNEFGFTHRHREIFDDGMPQLDPRGYHHISNISPAHRGIVAPADVAQTAYDLLYDVYEDVTIKAVVPNDNTMTLRLLTPFDMEVRPNGRQVGDVMNLGVDIRYRAGFDLAVSLFIERLVCTNGMTSSRQEFDWKSRSVGSASDQLRWIVIGITNVITEFDNIIERAKMMAGVSVGDDPRKALIERARAMKIPPRFDERLLAAYEYEPGNSEYDMLNAFTRLATHGGIPMMNADAIQAAAGAWTTDFDMVTARMPRGMALAVGAHIEE